MGHQLDASIVPLRIKCIKRKVILALWRVSTSVEAGLATRTRMPMLVFPAQSKDVSI